MQIQTDSTISGTILTIFFSFVSVQEIDIMAKIVAISATIVSVGFTSVHSYYKIKNLKNEKNNSEPKN
jgi:hypothetical protein